MAATSRASLENVLPAAQKRTSGKGHHSSGKKEDSAGAPTDGVAWEPDFVLSQRLEIQQWVSHNVKQMLDEGCTVPFIARYRKERTNNMQAEQLREYSHAYDDLKAVQLRVASVLKAIRNLDKLTDQLRGAIQAAQTLSEVEHLYAPYKPGNKRSLAERAREAGLEVWANKVLYQPYGVQLQTAVTTSQKGRSSVAEVEKGVQHIIADVISKDKDIMDMIRDKCQRAHITIQSSKSRAAASSKDKEDQQYKYENYFNFQMPVKFVKPHAVLAMNRGESQKILAVKINIPDKVKEDFRVFCRRKWVKNQSTEESRRIIIASIDDAYDRLVHPLMVRNIRADLTKNAERASIDVFATNLKNLLLTPPVRGKVVLGLDPGYKNGCKYAVTSITGQVLGTGVAYLHNPNNKSEVMKLRDCLQKHRCETIAIGNGTACRMAEAVLSDAIQARVFTPLNVSYCIVNENGASIYSASEEAQKELPDLDVTIRGAVSISRRLQDPLVELVKIEPKHIGVGMYQHDVPEKSLKLSLDGVVEECVSFVGVDLNVCTEYLLKHISGLNSLKAKNILAWREKEGSFINREQLLCVKGLGPKSYEQCVGFVRILPKTAAKQRTEVQKTEAAAEDLPAAKPGGKRKATTKARGTKAKKAKLDLAPNPLDMTCIHPESYHIADRFMADADINKDEIGTVSAISKAKQFLRSNPVEQLAVQHSVGAPTMRLITDGLQQPLHHDIRQEFEKPLFRKGLMSMGDLKPGQTLTGKVTNVTHFGAFVDIGVGQDGLIHTSKMRNITKYGKEKLDLGDRVEVKIENLDLTKKRIGLFLLQVL